VIGQLYKIVEFQKLWEPRSSLESLRLCNWY